MGTTAVQHILSGTLRKVELAFCYGKKPKEKAKTGPKPETLKLKGDWQALIGKALARKRPKKGWPKGG